MNKELYEKLVKPNVVELDNKIDQIDMSKAEGKIEEYDYQKELYNILTEKFSIIEDIALKQVNKNVKEFEEKENIKNSAEVRVVQYDKLQEQVKSSYTKITKALENGKNIKCELDSLDETGMNIYKNTVSIEQINKNIEIHKEEYTSNLPEAPRTFIQKIGEYFSKERREYIKVLKDYQKMIKIHANEGNKLVKTQFDIEKRLLDIHNNASNVEEKEFIDAIKLDEITIRIMNNNKEGNSNDKYIADTIGLIFQGILKQEIEKCILSDSQINDNEKYINYNNIFEKIEFAKNDVSYNIEKINELDIEKANLEIKEKINNLIINSNKLLIDTNNIMASNINQILELLNDIPKDKKNDYEQFIAKMCGKYPQLIQK
ncbi:MAG: hypothetical protein E7311_02240 [Clostridiales bacterium]|nr:hypothetical protein [Clostridiales bacterium]